MLLGTLGEDDAFEISDGNVSGFQNRGDVVEKVGTVIGRAPIIWIVRSQHDIPYGGDTDGPILCEQQA